MTDKFVKTKAKIYLLLEKIDNNEYKKSQSSWGGAYVVITSSAPKVPNKDNFYPSIRYVVTKYDKELTWLFNKLRDIFYDEQLLDSNTKIEFFGRLANGANHSLNKNDNINIKDLLRAVLHEALCILYEIKDNNFNHISIAVGNEIYDDLIDRSNEDESDLLSIEEIKKIFFRQET